MNTTSNHELPDDPLQEQLDAAEHLARLVVGEDDESFVLVFQSIVNVMDGFRARPGDAKTQARSVLRESAKPHVAPERKRRRKVMKPTTGAPADSIYADPIYLENAKRLIKDRNRIVGGIKTSDYRDCVAVGSADGWCCGDDVEQVDAGTVIGVADAVRHPDYSDEPWANDLCVLILDEDADVEPRELADDATLEDARTVRLAGYGNTDVDSSGGYGVRRMVDVPLAGRDSAYGAEFDKEFVAGAPFLDKDSCNGDSGGPAYVRQGDGWYLIGATSRATESAVRICGDGGIYTRVPVFQDWVKSIPGARWN
jgi:hypothetical protein